MDLILRSVSDPEYGHSHAPPLFICELRTISCSSLFTNSNLVLHYSTQQKSSSSVHINNSHRSGSCPANNPVVQTSVIQSTKAYTNGSNQPASGADQVDADADCVLITDEVLLDENVNNEEDVVDKNNKSSRAQELKQIKNQRLMNNIITMSDLSSDVEMENNGHIINGIYCYFF